MRVLIVTSFPIPGEYDGTAMLPIKITRALRSCGIDVALVYLKARRPWPKRALVDFEGVELHTLAPPDWVLGLRQIQKKFSFDLVHAQHYGGATRAYAACRLFGWPMVYEIHSLLGDEVDRDALGRDWKFRGYMALEKRVLKRAAHTIALGEPVKQVLIEEKGVPAERVSVIYPGIDLGEYEKPVVALDLPGIAPDDRVIMYIGSIVHPNQGVPLLIEALPRVFDAVPNAHCVLVGGPAEVGAVYREKLGRHAVRLHVLAGRTPADVVALSKRADVLVHARLACRENYSVQSKIAVYLAAGRPIVATDFGDYRSILGETGAGLLTPVDPVAIGDAIVRVLSDHELALRLAAAAGPVAREHFGMKQNIERYLDVYRKALAAGPRG